MCNIHKNSLLFFCAPRCIIIPEIRKDELRKREALKRRAGIMMKGFFNGLVAARTMELESERIDAKTLRNSRRAR